MPTYFTPKTFTFLKSLARHNERAWFQAHKAEYEEHLRQPYLRFIADLAEPLRKISPHYVADPKPVGGSLFRIHRDTRFAKDKKPYKEWAGSQYFHEASRVVRPVSPGSTPQDLRTRGDAWRIDAPVFYLHLQPGDCFAGGGVWHPQPETVKRIRDYLVSNPTSWKAATRSPAFRRTFGLDGDKLSRPPRGYDPAHPLIEDLKYKDFVATAQFADRVACGPDFPRFLLGTFRKLAPMMDWLCGALDLEF